MNPARPDGTAQSGGTSAPRAERILDELEAALRQQLRLAGNRDYDSLDELNRKVEELLGRATALPGPLSANAAECLRRIGTLRKHLLLSLAGRKDELAGKLGALGRAKRTLRAYRGST